MWFNLLIELWFRDKEMALHELHVSNSKCASVTAERDRLRDRIVEMELEVWLHYITTIHYTAHTSLAGCGRHVAAAGGENGKRQGDTAAGNSSTLRVFGSLSGRSYSSWKQQSRGGRFCTPSTLQHTAGFRFTLWQEWLQVHHALRSVVRKIEGDYGSDSNLNTRATAIMSNLQERALAEANAKAEVRRMQDRLTLVEVERHVLEKRLLEFDSQFVQMRARAAVAENAVAFQLQPSPRHQVLMSNAADIVRGSAERFGAVNERGQLALPMSLAQVKGGGGGGGRAACLTPFAEKRCRGSGGRHVCQGRQVHSFR